MSAGNFQELYKAGMTAFERGEYRLSVRKWEEALEIVPAGSAEGGEVGIWLVSAYQGLGDWEKSIAICRQLTRHPLYRIREQATRLLYIIEAPRLKRPEEWMSKIPELDTVKESEPKYKKGSSRKKKEEIPPPMELDRQKNSPFIWIAIGVILLILIGFAVNNS